MKTPPPEKTPFVAAVTIGVFYGLICQLFIRLHYFSFLYGIMSFGFVFILPFVLGVITLLYASEEQRASWSFRIFAPIVTTSLSLLVSVLVGWEGAICVVLAAGVFLPIASLGGIITGFFLTRAQRKKLQSPVLALLLSAPFLSAFIENRFDLPAISESVRTQIIIEAAPAAVWRQIVRVPEITEAEHISGIVYKMGFPRPVEATLSREGTGGVRIASFEGGLSFIETVDRWETGKLLSFTIVSDPNSVPTTTLDEHVVVGGRYFDVFRGTYEIVPLEEGRSLLKLSSEIRVSTRFNFYSNFWARLLMRDIQDSILRIIKVRSEPLTQPPAR